MNKLFLKYRRGLTIGFIFGLVISVTVIFGLSSQFFETLRPLAAPGRYAGQPFTKAIPAEEPLYTSSFVTKEGYITGQQKQIPAEWVEHPVISYHVTPLMWVVYFLINGIFYALIGAIVQSVFLRKKLV